jgi:hypothetical protein
VLDFELMRPILYQLVPSAREVALLAIAQFGDV